MRTLCIAFIITRIEVHFGDENGEKFGKNDKRCLLEARLQKY